MNYKIILLVFKNVKFGVILKSSRTIILSILIILAFSLSLGAISAQAIDDDSTGMMIDVDEETKEALIVDRIKAEKDLSLLDAEIDNKDTYLGRDIDYDISSNTKSQAQVE